jgi:hypothetical protein
MWSIVILTYRGKFGQSHFSQSMAFLNPQYHMLKTRKMRINAQTKNHYYNLENI